MPVTKDSLIIYVIYEKPIDYPEEYVIRRHIVTAGVVELEAWIYGKAPTLEAARDLLPADLYCLKRHPQDDAVIKETWL